MQCMEVYLANNKISFRWISIAILGNIQRKGQSKGIQHSDNDTIHVTNETTENQDGEVTREQLGLRNKLLNWRTLVPLGIAIVALAYAIKKAHIDPQKTWAAIQHANLLFFAVAFIIYYLSFGLRAWRWRVLLENIGYKQENGIQLPSQWKLTKIVYISFFANAIVPAKLGDLYRAYLLRQEIGVSTTRSFGTVLAERLLDLIVLLLLFIPAFLVSISNIHHSMPSQILLGMQILLGAVMVGTICLIALRVKRNTIAKVVPVRFREYYYHFQEGTLGSFRRLPLLVVQTVCVWTCEALRFFFIALALHLLGSSLLYALAASIFIGLGEALLTIIPATGGGVGLVEGGMAAMIKLFSDQVNQATAAIVLDRIITLFSIFAIGTIVFLLTFKTIRTQKTNQRNS